MLKPVNPKGKFVNINIKKHGAILNKADNNNPDFKNYQLKKLNLLDSDSSQNSKVLASLLLEK